MSETVLMKAQECSWCASQGWSAESILDRCSLQIEAGRWVALVGPNGAGKSTLLQLLAGTLGFSNRHFRGQIEWKGSDWCARPARERASRVAYVGSDLDPAFPLAVEEVVSSGVFASGDRRIIEPALEFCDLRELRHRRVEFLSGGERQRVALARALVQGAEVLFLDEAFSKMDLDYQIALGSRLQRIIKGEGGSPFQVSSIVLVAHDLSLSLRWADVVWVLHRGRVLAAGSLPGALSDEVLRTIYPKAAPSILLQK